jgi:hypothetical protein
MRYYFKIYYLIPKKEIMAKFKDRFSTIVSVNGESHIYTDNEGRELILESAKRGFIKIREHKSL